MPLAEHVGHAARHADLRPAAKLVDAIRHRRAATARIATHIEKPGMRQNNLLPSCACHAPEICPHRPQNTTEAGVNISRTSPPKLRPRPTNLTDPGKPKERTVEPPNPRQHHQHCPGAAFARQQRNDGCHRDREHWHPQSAPNKPLSNRQVMAKPGKRSILLTDRRLYPKPCAESPEKYERSVRTAPGN